MTRLRDLSGDSLQDALALQPRAQAADAKMWRVVRGGVNQRLYALVSVAVAGLLGCERFVDGLRGPLDSQTARMVATDWLQAPLSEAERAALNYAQKGTLTPATTRPTDLDSLRAAGFSDRDILSLAALVAYQNYALRAAAAFELTLRDAMPGAQG